MLPTHPVQAVDEFNNSRKVEIPGESALTVYVYDAIFGYMWLDDIHGADNITFDVQSEKRLPKTVR